MMVKDVPDILPPSSSSIRSNSPLLFTSIADNEFNDNLHQVQEQQMERLSITKPRKTNQSSSIFKSVRADRVLRTAKRTIYTAGRPPWYDQQGQSKGSFLIGICGGSASGKTTVAKRIIEALDVPWVTLLSMDSFYKVLNEEQQELARKNEYNFDHPDAFDFDLLIETLRKLKEGKRVDVPIYNFVTHRREKITVSI